MPCDQVSRTERKQRLREQTLKELEEDLVAGRRRISRNAAGQLAIDKWAETSAALSGQWQCEGCALAVLSTVGTWQVKSILANAGVKQGGAFVVASHSGHPHYGGGGHK